jgi:hypothetical protein
MLPVSKSNFYRISSLYKLIFAHISFVSLHVQTKDEDFVIMFINVISNLTEHQKIVVKKLGFGSLLKLSCLTIVNEIFH